MTVTISETMKQRVLENMIEKDLQTVTMFGIVFSTEKKENSLPTGYLLKTGQEIYIQP
ncbi:MAG TPA: hypothetical protein PLV89_10620 [Treponemataceae bacterium]|nr:hypothetical protein [Treponemataceae bacterium]